MTRRSASHCLELLEASWSGSSGQELPKSVENERAASDSSHEDMKMSSLDSTMASACETKFKAVALASSLLSLISVFDLGNARKDSEAHE